MKGVQDASTILHHVAGVEEIASDMADLADIDNDGTISIADATAILRDLDAAVPVEELLGIILPTEEETQDIPQYTLRAAAEHQAGGGYTISVYLDGEDGMISTLQFALRYDNLLLDEGSIQVAQNHFGRSAADSIGMYGSFDGAFQYMITSAQGMAHKPDEPILSFTINVLDEIPPDAILSFVFEDVVLELQTEDGSFQSLDETLQVLHGAIGADASALPESDALGADSMQPLPPREEAVSTASGMAQTDSTGSVVPTQILKYSYSTGQWKDQLTSITRFDVVNGYLASTTGTVIHSATYNSDGAPTVYNGKAMTWEGRQLKNYNGVTYTYDSGGMIIQKDKGYNRTKYYWSGTSLMGLEYGSVSGSTFTVSRAARFSYDAGGNVVSIGYANSAAKIDSGTYDEYYYLRNGQGDIIAIMDGNGKNIVEYDYDTWGKVTEVRDGDSTTFSHLATFHYRGYFYDRDTGLYFLNSRFYDASTNRFISPDVLMSTGQGVLGYNMYAYCLNNPVMFFYRTALVCA